MLSKHIQHFLILVFISLLVAPLSSWAFSKDDYFDHFKNRHENELSEFVRVAGWTSQFRGLSPSRPLGAFGLDIGMELTSIPLNAFHLKGYDLRLPPVFPRLNIAKGITRNLDIEVSMLVPKILKNQLNMPGEIEGLLIWGGGLKYTLLHEAEFFASLAARVSYTRLMLDFFKSDIYGADGSLSHSFKLSSFPVILTPYGGAGYVSTLGTFDQGLIPFSPRGKQKARNYRFFGGASLKVSLLDITGEIDLSDAPSVKTYSLKLGFDVEL